MVRVTTGFRRAIGIVALVLVTAGRGLGGIVLAPETDEERGLWNRALQEQQVLDASGFVVEDPELEEYLNGVVARLAAVDGFDPSSFSVRVLKDATLNAFAFPTGRIYIHTGLLARMLNEAQLAAVLSHEMTHATHRHTLKFSRGLKARTGVLAMVSSGAGDYRGVVELLGGLGTLAAVSGYSRGLEQEADTVGWERMTACGYDAAEAPAVFRLLLADLAASDRKEPFFFGSHPRLADRERNFERLNAGRKKEGDSAGETGAERYLAAIRPVLLINGELEMRAGRHVAARDQLWRYRAMTPSDVRVRWLIGENERLDKKSGNLAEARKMLAEAIALDPLFAPSYRSLGLIEYRAGERAAAAAHLRRFLELEPGAIDRAYLEAYIAECESQPSVSPSS